MPTWPDSRVLQLLDIELPILQAPMAGSAGATLAIAVAQAGGLGAIACAMLSPEQLRAEVAAFRARTARPLNLNFFAHTPPAEEPAALSRWRQALAPYYAEFGIDDAASVTGGGRAPFDETTCALVEELRPQVISFHFGLPAAPLLQRVKATGAKVLASATTVAEARWLQQHGCDAIIAQGVEAGGHRGRFLDSDVLGEDMSTQPGTIALVPQVVDAVSVPVIAAGGIGDARGIAAALALGAAAVQLGTVYLFTPEATPAPLHRAALRTARDDNTALTNVFTGRPARGVVNRLMRERGPLSLDAPPFPLATAALMPLRAKAEAAGSGDFQPLWSGEAAALGRERPAAELTRELARRTQALLARLAGSVR